MLVRAAVTKYSRLVAYKQEKRISHTICRLGGVSSKFCLIQYLVRELSALFLIGALYPIRGAPPHGLITSHRPQLLVLSHWMLGFQYMNLRRHRHSIHNTPYHWKIGGWLSQ